LKKFLSVGLFLVVAACSTSSPEGDVMFIQKSALASLADLGPAPELTNETWLNVPQPLRLADLRGKVVAIDMWTFG